MIFQWSATEWPGPNPTIASYNATGSLACFENQNISFYFEKTL
jgi:hypothetical protein